MDRVFNWGILGPGKIAHRFTEGLKLLDNAVLHAVGSRDLDRASIFAQQYGYKRYYGSYSDFVNDSELDAVYIASPHSHHMEHTLLCLEAGKHVICEKAFALNGGEVRKMIKLARSKNLFLMEALWPPFQPSYHYAKEILAEGEIGDLLSLHSYFAFKPPYEPEKRLYNPLLGGGALLDIGIYPVIDALSFLGSPLEIQSSASFADTGIDDEIEILFKYKDGESASLYSSLKSEEGVGTDLKCENGTISLRRLSDGSQLTEIKLNGKKAEEHIFKPEARGFQFEAMEVMSCINRGMIESEVVPLSFSLELIDTLDSIRKQSGIIYRDRE